ncbi:MAG: SGNH/GDSL hydrolase family protein [Anderseniella sp.]
MKTSKPGGPDRLRDIAVNLALVLVSLAFGYAVLGALLLAYGPMVVWKPFNKFPTAATIPWQPSGPSSKGQPYIAVFGDSYATGVGDWNYNRASRTQPYYSGDVISRELGMPVLSFGKSGAGSVRALVTNPGSIMNAESCSLLHSPSPPSSLVVYVYEGNDFNNNVSNLQIPPDGRLDDHKIADYIRAKAHSVESVPCYKYVTHIVVNLVAGYVKILFSREYEPAESTGQAVMLDGKKSFIPSNLQGPALELDGPILDTSIEVLSESLDHLTGRFKDTPVLVVHVPSVLTSYQFVGATVTFSPYYGGDPARKTAKMYSASDNLCARIQQLALSKKLSFLDARPDLREAAAKREIHGPLDWKHLNREGQTVLGMTVARSIRQDIADSGCARLAAAQ